MTFDGIYDGYSRIYIASFRKARVPRSEWIQVTDGRTDDKPRFSNDGKLMFFTSDRDGFVCFWAQRLGRRICWEVRLLQERLATGHQSLRHENDLSRIRLDHTAYYLHGITAVECYLWGGQDHAT